MLPIMRRGILLAALAVVVSIGSHDVAGAPRPKTPPPPMAPEPKRPERIDPETVLRLHMHENFDLLRAIERLLIFGKLDDAKRFAAAISEAPDAPAHGPWASHVVAVRDRAAALARATTVEQACRLEASLAGACAGCHVDTGVTPEFRVFPPLPPDKPTIEARMLRHRWAADRMWEATVSGADEPWRAGLDVLAATPLDWGPPPSERAAHARELQRLADQARKLRTASTLEMRTASYGEILVTCAACHTGKRAGAPAALRR
jgi:cytochrome c553